ncbi:MAG: acyltransferase domain-containing protein, partial [Kiritimatiellia bacterium]|nr:acyltransferase domain-containing protein [Kiritimatiellia bacterium]
MQIENILSEFGALDRLETVKPRWLESLASFPDNGPDFIRPEQIMTNLQWCGFEPDVEPVLVGAAGKIAANRSLLYLAWHYYRMIYDYEASGSPLQFVPLDKILGDDGPSFYLLVALAIVPRMRIFHQRLGIPEQVTRETCLQVKCFCENYRRANGGRLGIFVQQTGWLKNYVNGTLFFRLGRFEYWSQPFNQDYKVYRHRSNGMTMALAGPAWKINSSGLIEGIGAEAEDNSGWQTTLKQDKSGTCGFPINPKGFVEPLPVNLPEAEWECVLEKGVPVLFMHIPAGGGMRLEKCAESLREARKFFRRYFPSPAPRAIVCSSWMFSPILEQILPADSNLIKF